MSDPQKRGRFRRGHNCLAALSLAALHFGLALSVIAKADAPSTDAQATFLAQNQGALKLLAAEYLSDRFDFLDVKYLQPDAAGAEDGWAVAYRWDAEKATKRVSVQDGRFTISSIGYSLNVDGSYAFGATKNTNDLSTVTAAFRMERGDLGRLSVISTASRTGLQDCLGALSDPTDPNDTAAWRKLQEAEDACWSTHGIDRIIKGADSAYYYWLDFHGGVEGNQDFSNTHSVFGLNIAAAMQPTEAQSKYNVFDWPFRFMRKLGNASDYIAPFPSVRLALDRLAADDTREALTADSQHSRATGELAFQTRVATFDGRPVRFNFSYRYFYEISAPASIKEAGLDRFSFATASLRFPATLLPQLLSNEYEFFVGYNKGRLPFDLAGDESFEIGISTNIKQLGALLNQ